MDRNLLTILEVFINTQILTDIIQLIASIKSVDFCLVERDATNFRGRLGGSAVDNICGVESTLDRCLRRICRILRSSPIDTTTSNNREDLLTSISGINFNSSKSTVMHVVSANFKPLCSGSHHIPVRLTSKCLDRSLRCWDILEDIATAEGISAIDSDSIFSAVETNRDDRSQSNQSRIGVVVITQLICGVDVNSISARHPCDASFCWEFRRFQCVLNGVNRRVNNKFRCLTVVI